MRDDLLKLIKDQEISRWSIRCTWSLLQIVMERKVLEFGEVDLLGIGEVFIEGADRALKIAIPPAAPFGAGGWLRLITGRTWNSASLSVSIRPARMRDVLPAPEGE